MDFSIIFSYSWLGGVLIFTLIWAFIKREYIAIYNNRRRLFFVLGLVFARSISYTSIINVLMWYFTYYEGDLVTSAVLLSVNESLSSLFVIFMGHSADSFFGRFRTLVFSTSAYIGGLTLLWMFNPYDVKWFLVVILFLLALGTSGGYVLFDVIIDVIHEGDHPEIWSYKQSVSHAAVVWRIVHVIGAISATLWFAHDAIGGVHISWRTSFFICLIVMFAAFMIFWGAHDLYDQGPLTERPVQIFFRVFRAGIQNFFNSNRRYTTDTIRQGGSTDKLDTEGGENEHIRSPITGQDNLDTEGGENEHIRSPIRGQDDGGSRTNTQEDMVIVKSLSRLFPMWGMFFVVSIVSATGSTFFIEQYSNLNTDNKIPIQIYNLIQALSAFVIPFIYRWIVDKYHFRKNEKVKIGVGMLCGILCCVFAWQLEVHRLKAVDHLVIEDQNTSISFLWLMPQFCVLGFMEGLTGDGLLRFYMLQIRVEPIRSYGGQYAEVVQCLGKLFNITLIVVLNRKLGWFGYTINDSRLDKYYRLLVWVCSGNLVLYCCIVKCFYNGTEPTQAPGDDDMHRSN